MYQYQDVFEKYVEEFKVNHPMPIISWEQLYTVVFKNFLLFLADRYNNVSVANITGTIMQEYFNNYDDVRNATIKARFSALSKFFRYLYKTGKSQDVFMSLEVNHFLMDETTFLSKLDLTENEFTVLENFVSCKDNDLRERLLLALIIRQGLKRGEILGLDSGSIDEFNHLLYTTKNNKKKHNNKEKPIGRHLLSDVEALLKEFNIKSQSAPNTSLLGYKNSKDSQLNNELNNLCVRLIKRRVTPALLREHLRKNMLVKHIASLNVISAFFDESAKTTEDTIYKHKLYEYFPLDDYVCEMFDPNRESE